MIHVTVPMPIAVGMPQVGVVAWRCAEDDGFAVGEAPPHISSLRFEPLAVALTGDGHFVLLQACAAPERARMTPLFGVPNTSGPGIASHADESTGRVFGVPNIAGSASGCRSLSPHRLRHAGGCNVDLPRGALQGEVPGTAASS